MYQTENKKLTGSHFLTLIAFHTALTAIQIQIQKIIAASKPVQVFNGTAVAASTYTFTLLRNTNVTTYVTLTHVFLVGSINFTTGISSYDFQLYSCINSSVKFNPHHHS